MDHKWQLVKKSLTTALWRCSNCECDVMMPSQIEINNTTYHKVALWCAPSYLCEKDRINLIEEILKHGKIITCLSRDERMIKDIIE